MIKSANPEIIIEPVLLAGYFERTLKGEDILFLDSKSDVGARTELVAYFKDGLFYLSINLIIDRLT